MYKYGIIGYGYWGKIIHHTLVTHQMVNSKNDDNIIIYDPFQPQFLDYKKIIYCSHIFVSNPVLKHYETCYDLIKIQRIKNIFCEKPLTGNPNKSFELFDLAKHHDAYLFVDWIFLFNDHVQYLAKLIVNKSLGKLKSINMNRLNLGPVRNDIDAKTDLAVHDFSMLYYLLNPNNVHRHMWTDYKRKSDSIQNDSCVGLLMIDDVFVQINCSWHYGKKDRTCIFEFEEGFVVWDDITKTIKIDDVDIKLLYNSPLENSINCFLNKTVPQEYIQKVTFFVENLLCTLNSTT